jgi:hypothetical protein
LRRPAIPTTTTPPTHGRAERDDREDEIARLKSKVGEITMDNELLSAKIAAMTPRSQPPQRLLKAKAGEKCGLASASGRMASAAEQGIKPLLRPNSKTCLVLTCVPENRRSI